MANHSVLAIRTSISYSDVEKDNIQTGGNIISGPYQASPCVVLGSWLQAIYLNRIQVVREGIVTDCDCVYTRHAICDVAICCRLDALSVQTERTQLTSHMKKKAIHLNKYQAEEILHFKDY